MTRLVFPFAVMCVAVVAAIAQQSSAVTQKRSNVKDNLTIAPGPKGTLMCKSDGKPCTPDQVKGLAATYHIVKGNTKALAVAPDGLLLCDEKACTAEHLTELTKAADATNRRAAGQVIEKQASGVK